MKPDLRDLIEEAKRQVRLASGLPLTVEEQDDERRRQEREQLMSFMLKTFGVTAMVLLRMDVAWHGGSAVIAMTAEGTQFHLRKAPESFVLFALGDDGEQPLGQFPSKDPQLGNRVIVAIGDEIEPTSGMDRGVPHA